MTNRESASESHAGPGEIADEIGQDENIKTCWMHDDDDEPVGFLIDWRTDPEEWMYGDVDAIESLDSMM